MIPMAFTNYSTINKHLTLFDWVGLANFKTVLGLGGKIGKTFWRVLGWTIVWAVCATFLCNFLGLILAIVINRKETSVKHSGVPVLLFPFSTTVCIFTGYETDASGTWGDQQPADGVGAYPESASVLDQYDVGACIGYFN